MENKINVKISVKKIFGMNNIIFLFLIIFACSTLGFAIYNFSLKKEIQLQENKTQEEKFKNRMLQDTIWMLKQKVANIEELYKPTKDNVWFWINYFKLKNPLVVMGQIVGETDMRSKIFIQTNNLFNIHFVPKRKSTANGHWKVYCRYDNFVESIKDYKLLQDAWHVPVGLSNEKYIMLLHHVKFATDTTYLKGFKR